VLPAYSAVTDKVAHDSK